jgi:hypothetical protein
MSGLTTIKLSSEELKKEQERQRKRGRLIFNTFKKGKVKVVIGRYDEDGTVPDIIFQYQIHDAHFRSIVDYTNGEVICVMDCFYDDIDILNEDGSEITEKLPLWLVSEIENKIEDKFASFNIELRYMQQSDGKGKKSLVNEEVSERQKMINKTRVIYKAHRNGHYDFKYGPQKDKIKRVSWVLPSKFSIKIKEYSQEDSERYGYENYPILTLNTETINFITEDGKPIQSGEKMVIGSKITNIFKKYGITIYWTGNGTTKDDYTDINITPKSK